MDTEGFSASDLKGLVGRATHAAVYRRISSSATTSSDLLLQSDFEDARCNYTPSSLRGVKLTKSTVSWSDIGGLKETKAVLLETLEWPTRYAPLFAQCPLRLRSGLLLYGPPGCGKTYLASAVARECGLNFVSIKGFCFKTFLVFFFFLCLKKKIFFFRTGTPQQVHWRLRTSDA